MSNTIFVIPNTGLKVIDPFAGDYLPAEGREVAKSTYWRRRLQDGDVTEGNARKAVKQVETLVKAPVQTSVKSTPKKGA
ncbi:MAG: DUF2635 domain-containing protein [Alphaproteobacteria bacterium]|nr:DUF2635 domain-containing protein [Alphaproteobacteria bacterium]